MEKGSTKFKQIAVELSDHLPFTIFGVITSMLLMGILTFFAALVQNESGVPEASHDLFHIFHPFHILFSAITTTAMFWKHDNRNVLKAVVIGFIGSVAFCGISDIIVPYLGGKLFGFPMHFHVCLIEEPQLIIPFAILGVFTGLVVTKSVEHSTQYSHAMHVFLSSTASLLYLIAYGLEHWVHQIPEVFFITVVAVVFPCCFSDIIFPMLCTHKHCCHE